MKHPNVEHAVVYEHTCSEESIEVQRFDDLGRYTRDLDLDLDIIHDGQLDLLSRLESRHT
jgi:hypothetical protein